MNARKLLDLTIVVSLVLVPLGLAQVAQAAPAPTGPLTSASSAQSMPSSGDQASPRLAIPPAVPSQGPMLQGSVLLSVTKLVANENGDPLYPGERITYTITISNGGSIPATGVAVSDTFPPNTSYVPDSIAITPSSAGTPGASGTQPVIASGVTVPPTSTVTVTFAVTANSPLTDGTLITNMVSVTSTEVSTPTTSQVTSRVTATQAVTVVKSGPANARLGDDVTYTFTITNTSSSGTPNLVMNSITDSLLGDLADEAPAACDQLAPNTSCSFTVDRIVGEGDADPLPNTVTVHYHPTGLDDDVSASDSHSVNIVQPAVQVAKSGPASASVGKNVTYTFRITNTSSNDTPNLLLDSITDTLLGNLTDQAPAACDEQAPNASCNFTANRVVLAGDADPLSNTVTVLYHPNGLSGDVSASDSHEVNLLLPGLQVAKSGPASARVGDDVTYTFRITNTSSSDTPNLVMNSITDSLLGDLADEAPAACDQLAPNASCSFTANRVVLAGDADPLANTVTVTYHPTDLNDDVTASDSHSVNLFQPGVTVVKSGPASAKVGDNVTYTFRITNTSSSDTPNLIMNSITDNRLGDLADEAPAACDQLAPNASCSFTASRVVLAGDADPLVNTVTVTYHPNGLVGNVTDSDSHSLGIDFKPVLRVIKSAQPPQAQVGMTVTYSFLVLHASSSDLSSVSQVTLSDNLLGPITSPSGDGNGNNVLDAGEIWEYSADYVVKPTDPDALTNTATVTGRDRDNQSTSATAAHSLNVEFSPALTIVKSGPATAIRGQKVTYTFAVSHSGGDGSPVDGVVVNDNLTGPAVYVAGDDGDGRLEQGETWNHTATYTIPYGAPNPLVNSATVTAQDKDGDNVMASDTHSLELQNRLVYLPLIARPSPTILSVHNDNTGGDVTVIVRTLGTNTEVTRCTVPNKATLPCDHNRDGSNVFQPGTYNVYVASVCGPPVTVVKTYPSGPQTTRVFCQ